MPAGPSRIHMLTPLLLCCSPLLQLGSATASSTPFSSTESSTPLKTVNRAPPRTGKRKNPIFNQSKAKKELQSPKPKRQWRPRHHTTPQQTKANQSEAEQRDFPPPLVSPALLLPEAGPARLLRGLAGLGGRHHRRRRRLLLLHPPRLRHCFTKRLPTGERRRVSIARELVMRPHILFIDEPLYHLDSVSALLLMVTLKKLASTGCTVIFTMYQSSTEVFGLFDRICLLSNGNTLFFGETLACLQHFSNAGFPCPIMQSPSDHFLRAINTDFDRIIAMCKNLQDDQGDFSSVSMDTAVAIRTLEATYKSSAESAAVESMIAKLIDKEGPCLKSKGRASDAARIGILTWRSLLIMSRDWKYFWSRLVLYMLLALSIGTIFIDIGHSLSSVVVRISAIFVFVSFLILLSVCGVPAHIDEIKIYSHEDSNRHSGTLVFLLGHFLSSIPFLFLVSISSSLVFYFLIGLRNEFSFLMYFIITIFMCLLANEALMMIVAYIWLETYKCTLTLICLYVIMMVVAGYFRIREAIPSPVWNYPLSYISFHTYAVQGLVENEYVGTSFAVGATRTIPGVQAVRGSYGISSSTGAKWRNLLILFLMAIGYRVVLYVLLRLDVRRHVRFGKRPCWPSIHTSAAPK